VLGAVHATNVFADIDTIVLHVVSMCQPGDQVVVMSNGGFGGIHAKLLNALGAIVRQK